MPPEAASPAAAPQAQRCRPRWCAGVLVDAASLRARWASDWREGLLTPDAPRALAAGVFAFFAQAAPAVTFAGLLSQRTGGACGVAETLLGMGAAGLLFALCAGQPLVLVGTTGPVVILVASLSDVARGLGLGFRGALFFTCAWAAAFHALLAAAGAPRAFVAAVTPFSGEVFGALVGCVYVAEGAAALAALAAEGGGVAAGGSGALSLGLGVGCALLAALLTRARAWRWPLPPPLPAWPWPRAGAAARGLVADYGLALAVVAAAAAQLAPQLAAARAALPLLPVPPRFAPSEPARPWLDADAITGFPPWAAAACAGPGAVLTALLFFDHQISAMLTQEPRFRLRKPPSYDLDFLLLGASLMLTATLGLPPVYGLLPQAPLHVRALALVRPGIEGQAEEEWLAVCETRWSAALQACLLLVLLAPAPLALLGALPQGVLAGMLVFLGVAGLEGNGVVRRAAQLLRGRRRDFGGAGAAGRGAAAALTLLQALLVAATFGITLSSAALAFPLAIVALVPLRLHVLPRVFGAEVIEALDPRDWGASLVENKDKAQDAATALAGGEEEARAAATAALASEKEGGLAAIAPVSGSGVGP
jgi:hypothetical protein